MNEQQQKAAAIVKAPEYTPVTNQEFLKLEISRLKDRCKNQFKRIEDLQAACDFYQDKASTLEKMLVDAGLMVKSKL